jgi:hypothetical protein
MPGLGVVAAGLRDGLPAARRRRCSTGEKGSQRSTKARVDTRMADGHDFHSFHPHCADRRRGWQEVPPMSVVRIEHVCKDYLLGEQKVQALKDITLAFDRASFWRLPVLRAVARRPC